MAKDPYANIEDKELLDKYYQDGNNQWLGILLQRYTLLLLGVCMKYLKNEEEAKDTVQQIFLKVISELQKYKVEYFKSWLYMITRNYCLMKIRDRHGKIPVELTENINAAEDEREQQTQLKEKEKTLTVIEESLHELSEEQKQCVTLFYLQKKSYQQIVDETGYSLLQVKSYIQNGKRNLKMIVERKMKQG
ncbi:MAG: sigma-70 family polymerase sigma factor [Segetibacter sp.]|nr:sigma-70 family polymerase sigma factor [Segetibacter sp.]